MCAKGCTQEAPPLCERGSLCRGSVRMLEFNGGARFGALGEFLDSHPCLFARRTGNHLNNCQPGSITRGPVDGAFYI